MRIKAPEILNTLPFYLVLLPLFFILHGYLENIEIIYASEAMVLAGWYLLATALLWGICWLIFRNRQKASLATFTLMAFNFFFGSVHDLLKKIEVLPFLSRYIFILPAMLIGLVLLFIWLKRSRRNFTRLTRYLNILFLVLLLLDTVSLIVTLNRKKIVYKVTDKLDPCKDCLKPDIYLIVADSYPGNTELRETMNFDNSPFENELRSRGFHVADSSHSNYNSTTLSIASMLNMNYIAGGVDQGPKVNLEKGYGIIRNSQLPDFMKMQGYAFYNFSIFDMKNMPSITQPTFLPRRTSTITAQTFTKRIMYNLGFHLIDKLKLKFVMRSVRNLDLRNNNKVITRTKKIAAKKTGQPKFVYTHVIMPHYPYYFDSTGASFPIERLNEGFIHDLDAFKSYLVYANAQYLKLVDYIQEVSDTPPVIILMGDHGFREFTDPVEKKYHFMNLLAISTPGRDYAKFYPGMSNVNLFRVLLNLQFRQQLPVLEDSTIFVPD